MVRAMSDPTTHWTLRERALARSRLPAAGVFTNLRQARRHLALALRAAAEAQTWAEEDRRMLADAIGLVRGQLDLLVRLPERPR